MDCRSDVTLFLSSTERIRSVAGLDIGVDLIDRRVERHVPGRRGRDHWIRLPRLCGQRRRDRAGVFERNVNVACKAARRDTARNDRSHGGRADRRILLDVQHDAHQLRLDQLDAFHLAYLDAVKLDRRIHYETGDGILRIDLIGRVVGGRKEIPNQRPSGQNEQECDEQEPCLHVDVHFHCAAPPNKTRSRPLARTLTRSRRRTSSRRPRRPTATLPCA